MGSWGEAPGISCEQPHWRLTQRAAADAWRKLSQSQDGGSQDGLCSSYPGASQSEGPLCGSQLAPEAAHRLGSIPEQSTAVMDPDGGI